MYYILVVGSDNHEVRDSCDRFAVRKNLDWNKTASTSATPKPFYDRLTTFHNEGTGNTWEANYSFVDQGGKDAVWQKAYIMNAEGKTLQILN